MEPLSPTGRLDLPEESDAARGPSPTLLLADDHPGQAQMSTTSRPDLPDPREMPAPTTATPPAAVPPAKRVAMMPWRLLTVGGLVVAVSFVAWQLARVFGGTERSSMIAWISLLGAIAGVAGLLIWTWAVIENARRLFAPATTQTPPDPRSVVLAWIPAMVVAGGAAMAVAYLQRRLVLPENDTSSALPLALAAVALMVTMVLSLGPLGAISSALRRLGGSTLPVGRLIWVPIALAVVGAASLAAMRAGGLFGDDFTGIAPAWALGVVMILPVVIVLSALWRGAVAAEDAVQIAFDRRNSVSRTGQRSRWSVGRLLRAEARPRLPRADSKPIRLVPGADALRLAMFIALAALCLIAIVGALVMVLFWRESREGVLIPAQEDRAWEVLGNLQVLQRSLAIGLLAVTTGWAFVSVLNARLATGRRRNPLLAAASWPLAALAIWRIADRIVGEQPLVVVIGFMAQAAVFAVPFLLLERAALAVHAHRSPLRLSYALGVVLLVLNQGLMGLSTLDREPELNNFGRLAGSLAVAALLQLVASLSVSESSRLVADAAADLAADHNALVASRPTGTRIDVSASVSATDVVVSGTPVASPAGTTLVHAASSDGGAGSVGAPGS
ncbi:MAG: hypothetical protein AAFP84_06840 [Actinomycetota bacterium]